MPRSCAGKCIFWMNDGDPNMAAEWKSGDKLYVYRYKLSPASYGYAW